MIAKGKQTALLNDKFSRAVLLGMNSSICQENALMEYRNQLSAYDKTIQDYQDILDGKTALPDQMRIEDISQLLEATKEARETFLQKGAEKLNEMSAQGVDLNSLGSAYDILVPNGSRDNERWNIDPSADDIYSEIDHALTSTRKVTSIFEDIGSRVSAELKRRGNHQSWVEFSPRSEWKDIKRPSPFQDIYGEIWSQFRKSV